ncbi:MAG: hypothetical protein HYV60_06245 [Planctomycetia bacterium]|nr:hypothetical protein [Planctomycetia bacterium]
MTPVANWQHISIAVEERGPSEDRPCVNRVFVRFGIALLLINVPAQRMDKRIDELAAEDIQLKVILSVSLLARQCHDRVG